MDQNPILLKCKKLLWMLKSVEKEEKKLNEKKKLSAKRKLLANKDHIIPDSLHNELERKLKKLATRGGNILFFGKNLMESPSGI